MSIMWLQRALLTLILCFCAEVSFAKEAIQKFDVTIDVDVSGDFVVTEKLAVNVEGRTIRRGIFRDLPRYLMLDDFKLPQRYKVLSVTRNGKKEPNSRSVDGNAQRLLIGDEDVFLDNGVHIYEIKYLIKDQIRRAEDFDEIYWNVTGNYWQYAIESATAMINMPDGVKLLSQNIYTGSMGEAGKDAIFSEENGVYIFKTTRPFAPGGGLTVSLSFEKGIMGDVSGTTKRFIWWIKNGALTLLSLSLFGITGFYYWAWRRVGRDPQKGAVFPRYEPPKGYSAAAVSYIYYRGIKDNKPLIATLMSLKFRDYIDIKVSKKQTLFTNKKLDKIADADLPVEDLFLYHLLFGKTIKGRSLSQTVKLTHNTPHKRFSKADASFQTNLYKNFSKDYYKRNGGYIALGILFSVCALFIVLSQLYGKTGLYFWLGILGLVATNIVFMVLMPAPTLKGQKVRNEIEGFRLYLKTAEKNKLDAVNPLSESPPPMSVEHYEKMLPYAIALGVEEPWSDYFEAAIPTEAAEYATKHTDAWGGNTGRAGLGSVSGLTNSLVSSINTGVSTSKPQSSTSSGSSSFGGGSSGGGSSGGGGGGGGGGGW